MAFGVQRPTRAFDAVPRMNAMERIIDEGLLIALSAVRMAVKNHIIVGALREHDNFDEASYATVARDELLLLAVQNEEDAARVAKERRELASRRWSQGFTEDERLDLGRLARRRRAHKGLALILHAVADDDEKLAAIVENAQHDASYEIRKALAARLIRQTVDGHAPGYARMREERIKYLLAIDFAMLRDRTSGTNP
ncbi:hypothetical protein E3O44_07415 [Cryobacterium algoricola]|uniref:Asparagine synthase n=1 Tax=Cryobacterium algoricola TaxID=1259183 RepID=A0ABY2IEI9_9MICO|nr:hypothetical protein [Cryobacterium algoricola]TFB86983.1 hypothetical protein E3O44_07415 [Cryobacterium algoricola]